jgi:hypothetical protein
MGGSYSTGVGKVLQCSVAQHPPCGKDAVHLKDAHHKIVLLSTQSTKQLFLSQGPFPAKELVMHCCSEFTMMH